MNDVMPTPDNERLAALVFELASQLHVERSHRIALEVALVRAGVIDVQVVDSVSTDAEFKRRKAAELDVSMQSLMQVLTEHAKGEH